ncbi:MAG TPA: NADH-ubiquinone oxidoreductase-F iron-sulfur binding region domain-containing protein [Solirubrobacteraceae bacterium]|nr:NADH-ubiquinone oxidoreductase-F iron-sulfur binding region domain-containing protein [Solirubrobacteraceae bacterium]
MSAAGTATRTQRAPVGTPPAGSLPRLLAGVSEDGGRVSVTRHFSVHGGLPLTGARRSWGRREHPPLIEETHRAGLRGRGGAAFPLARKLLAVAAARGPAVVVANGTEGEPASEKDAMLMELAPHLVLDGLVAAAEALGAREALIATCELDEDATDSMALAVEERDAAGIAPHHAPSLRVVTAPGHYVAGQETALVSYLDGGPALPTFTPPLPFERGVGRRPTLVSNVETLAHLALVARHGAGWFRALGTPASTGSTLVTLAGPVARPGVYEIALGSSLESLARAAGGTTREVRGALIGGYAGAFVPAESLRGLALSDEHLAAHGGRMGSGVVALLSSDCCPVAETARVARWMAEQSSGQCGPCVNGLDALAGEIEAVARGRATDGRLEQLSATVARRGACGHPDGVVSLVGSALEAFPSAFAHHARGGPCDRCASVPELPLPAGRVASPRSRTRRARR